MYSAKHTWQHLSISLVVAIGIALVWGMLAGWCGTTLEKALWHTNNVSESIAITVEGTPLIRSYTRVAHNRSKSTYRTFDGQPVTLPKGGLLNESSTTQAPAEPPGLSYEPVEWRWRIAGISDLGQPSIGWYLIRDDQPSGHAYLVGYDMKSKQLAGYIGRNGFCSSMPSEEEQFEHDNRPYGWMMGSACSTGYIGHGHVAPEYDYNQRDFDLYFPKWLLFLVDGDQLQEIDLRTRKVRALYQSPKLVGVSFLRTEEADAEEGGKKKMVRRLMLRLADRVVVLDRSTGDEREYLLPESMQMQRLSVCTLDDGQLLLVSQDYGAGSEGRNQTKLVWYSSDGQMTQEKEVSLVWHMRLTPQPAQMAMAALVVAPIPLGWSAVVGIIKPLVAIQENKVPDYITGLQKMLPDVWPAMVVVALLAFAAAGIALRLHRKYHRPQAWVWCLFVFLLGPAGLVAYWLEHRRAVLESCASCGKTVPRDRDGCAACGETFPAPALVGTEVFA